MQRRLALSAFLIVTGVASGQEPSGGRGVSAFERDRQSILAMAGTFAVRYNFRETVAFVEGYKPAPGGVIEGHEVVIVAEDLGKTIRLQHLLVVEGDRFPIVVKHWRQDWTYEPTTVVEYRGGARWDVANVSKDARKHAWSQTVWGNEDTPRYGGVGRWRYDNGVARWESGATWRPLALRDEEQNPPYDHYVGVNTHELTPSGWAHEQANDKVGSRGSDTATYVREFVVNSYMRDARFDSAPATKYWANTSAFWSGFRVLVDSALARDRHMIFSEVQDDTASAPSIDELASGFASGNVTLAEALGRAREVLARAIAPRGD